MTPEEQRRLLTELFGDHGWRTVAVATFRQRCADIERRMAQDRHMEEREWRRLQDEHRFWRTLGGTVDEAVEMCMGREG